MTTPHRSTQTDMPVFQPIAPGVELGVLRRHADRGMTFLIRMAPGAHAPLHDQPGGEETYMLAGRLRIAHRTDATGAALADATVAAGEYFFAPPGETHDGYAEEAALFFVVAPGGVTRPVTA